MWTKNGEQSAREKRHGQTREDECNQIDWEAFPLIGVHDFCQKDVRPIPRH